MTDRNYQLEFTATQFEKVGRRVAEYWEQFDEHEPIPGADLVEFIGLTMEKVKDAGPDLQDDLAKEHGYWGEHPDFPQEEWARQAQKNTTRVGYWEWVANQVRLRKHHP